MDHAAEVLAVHVGGVEEVLNSRVDLVEEGLCCGGDVIAGDDGGLAGCGQENGRAVMSREDLPGLTDGLQQRFVVVSGCGLGCSGL